jgi:hypothetical protein
MGRNVTLISELENRFAFGSTRISHQRQATAVYHQHLLSQFDAKALSPIFTGVSVLDAYALCNRVASWEKVTREH